MWTWGLGIRFVTHIEMNLELGLSNYTVFSRMRLKGKLAIDLNEVPQVLKSLEPLNPQIHATLLLKVANNLPQEYYFAMTNTDLIHTEIRRFLKSTDAEVLCVTGKWGVGKTFTWQSLLLEAQSSEAIGMKRYSYVSLFGLNSLQDLKTALFEQTLQVGSIGKEYDLKSLEASLKTGINFLRQQASKVGGGIPYLREYISSTSSFFFTVRNQIICLDDLERAGKGLLAKDALGMISLLREDRKCKVVLLLNHEELDDEDKKEFDRQLEKVVDIKLEYQPSPEEAAKIGLDQSLPFHDRLVSHVTTLGITNLRVIKKIERVCQTLSDLLQSYETEVRRQAVHSAALFGWMVYQPKQAPSIDLIRSLNSFFRARVAEEASDQEKTWRALLTRYEFTRADEFDLAIYAGINAGFFDPKSLNEVATELDKKVKHQKLDNSFSEAWNLYHHSFTSTADEVLDQMKLAARSSAKVISPINISATIALFKNLGRPEDATQILADYMEQRDSEERDFFDLRKSVFGGEVKDSDVRKAFEKKLASFVDSRDAKTILINTIRNNGWNAEDIEWLAENVKPNDFKELFKENIGDDLSVMIQAALKFGTYDDATEAMKKVAISATEALREIAGESEINAQRIARYGIGPKT